MNENESAKPAEALLKAFSECIQSLQDEMLMSYGGQKPEDMHPVTRRNYDRDMAEIASYHAAISAANGDIEALYQQCDQFRAENEALRTVMIAAAEEISKHWGAHCDSEGYGPVNLMHRLERGIPSEYGYTAGAFAKLRAENEALRAFSNKIISASFEDATFENEGVCIGDIQVWGLEYGLLRIEKREHACGEYCTCQQYGFPSECCQKTELLREVRRCDATPAAKEGAEWPPACFPC